MIGRVGAWSRRRRAAERTDRCHSPGWRRTRSSRRSSSAAGAITGTRLVDRARRGGRGGASHHEDAWRAGSCWPEPRLLLVIQVLPFGRDHANPPVRQEPPWDSARTWYLWSLACFDCHSNQTHTELWEDISRAALVGGSPTRRPRGGPEAKLNFSEWGSGHQTRGPGIGPRRSGRGSEMPPWYSPWARLTASRRQALIRGLDATLGRGAR